MASQSNPLISLRSLSRLAPELTGPVDVTHRVRGDDGARVIGTFTPAATAPRATQDGSDFGEAVLASAADPPLRESAAELPGSPGAPYSAARRPATPRQRQAATDAVLRKVNRGKS